MTIGANSAQLKSQQQIPQICRTRRDFGMTNINQWLQPLQRQLQNQWQRLLGWSPALHLNLKAKGRSSGRSQMMRLRDDNVKSEKRKEPERS